MVQWPADRRSRGSGARRAATVQGSSRAMKNMFRLIDRCVAESTRIPYEWVPHDPARYLGNTPTLKIAKKFLHRRLSLAAGGQLALARPTLPRDARILWLYTGKSNFGDATMDMAGRSLLRGAGMSIDLLTLPKLRPLFEEDDVFSNVFDRVDDALKRDYDAILLNEFNFPSIRLKKQHFRRLPFASLFGYFYGPDRNQTQFSFAAINHIFELGLTPAYLRDIAKPYLHSNVSTERSVDAIVPDTRYMCIAVGGIDPRRTYERWTELLSALDDATDIDVPPTIVLLGAPNGADAAEAICRHTYARFDIRSTVGQLSLLQSRAMVARSAVFVGCDGGMMHVAHSTDVGSVTLFAHIEPMHLRLTPSCNSIGLQSRGAVSEIDPPEILSALRTKLGSTSGQLLTDSA
ncbi:heptosyltransferase [Burkholderia ubonensis]|nr:heptosyltransferase [Burkholderia ubonensis]KVO53167.1 heptosyltransferase [Burkholderia ubonensis]KVP74606.1 heptosyltransferase [Burkholderia ubonensis]KVR51671.1 heptosyltransferase [Burkholderia ubonensis]KVX28031.1 heptosyltransferase [Burkholderia ubonensis]